VLTVTATVAQQSHNQYEPPNSPGAGQRLLVQFAGDWDVVKTFFPMTGKPIVTKGGCKQYMIEDGKFLQSDFTFFNSDGTKSCQTAARTATSAKLVRAVVLRAFRLIDFC
jgi:hypothetical protein